MKSKNRVRKKELKSFFCPDCGTELRYIGRTKNGRDLFKCLCGREFTKKELKEGVAE